MGKRAIEQLNAIYPHFLAICTRVIFATIQINNGFIGRKTIYSYAELKEWGDQAIYVKQ